MVEAWEPVPVSGVENAAYYFSTYNAPDKVGTSNRKKIMVLGGGPNRIGQGIEFDYCCVHAAFALRDEGYESIMVNCNPETVSTDYDTSDKLYFEPLTVEDVLCIYEKEKPEGVIVQFGGQTPLNIAGELAKAGVKIIGTSPETIDLAEDRDRFRKMMEKLGIPMPESGMASNLEEALAIAARIGYPLMVRPSYVLGGRGMEVVHDEEMLKHYVAAGSRRDAGAADPDRQIPGECHRGRGGRHFRRDRCLCSRGHGAYRTGRDPFRRLGLRHPADQHPRAPYRYDQGLYEEDRRGIQCGRPDEYPVCHCEGRRLYPGSQSPCLPDRAAGFQGLQYLHGPDRHPGHAGKKLRDLNLKNRAFPHFGVKEAVFPFNMFQEVDPVLGPEMRSTGEVLGLADSFGLAFYKAQEAAQQVLPGSGTVLITVADGDKGAMIEVAREFQRLGFKIKATEGTHEFLPKNGIECERILKMHEGRPNIVDGIKNKEIQLIINTPNGRLGKHDDSYIRKAAIKYKVPYITTAAAAVAAVKGISAFRRGHGRAKSLQDYHRDIK